MLTLLLSVARLVVSAVEDCFISVVVVDEFVIYFVLAEKYVFVFFLCSSEFIIVIIFDIVA